MSMLYQSDPLILTEPTQTIVPHLETGSTTAAEVTGGRRRTIGGRHNHAEILTGGREVGKSARQSRGQGWPRLFPRPAAVASIDLAAPVRSISTHARGRPVPQVGLARLSRCNTPPKTSAAAAEKTPRIAGGPAFRNYRPSSVNQRFHASSRLPSIMQLVPE